MKIPKDQKRKLKDRQYHGQTKNDKRTNHDTQKTKDGASRTILKTGDERRCSERVSSSCSISETRRVTVKRHEHHLIRKTKHVYILIET